MKKMKKGWMKAKKRAYSVQKNSAQSVAVYFLSTTGNAEINSLIIKLPRDVCHTFEWRTGVARQAVPLLGGIALPSSTPVPSISRSPNNK
jgi:hypothetical protein